ncbi:Transcriptional regulator, LysR family [Sphingomonas paucimobilis]|uniref:LysR family transcriptional regulator n=1 Tax=Sphingobium sp. DC-2 TaxID=1303256 RepID=UPI00044B46A5|nr:LysR family transcriptional regulator [Sphingobium sp. DC-2]EZP71996.1 Transcriptional regulator, LysR family [Sphingomonas paucimobilis]
MNLSGLDLNLLVALDALLAEQNVTRAAEQLNVTQPAMSSALQKLRHQMGDPLLERVGRQFVLSPRAQAIRQPVKDLLRSARYVMNTEASFAPDISERQFVIAMSDYCVEILGVALLEQVAQAAPAVSIRFEAISERAIDWLREGRIDIFITAQHSQLLLSSESYEFAEECLFSDEFVLVAGKAAGRIDPAGMSYREFCKFRYIDVHFGQIRSNTTRLLDKKDVRPRTMATAPSFLHAMQMVAVTDYVTLAPLRSAQRHAARLGLRILPAPFKLPALDEICLYNARSQCDPGHAWMMERLRAAAQSLGSGDRSRFDPDPAAAASPGRAPARLKVVP